MASAELVRFFSRNTDAALTEAIVITRNGCVRKRGWSATLIENCTTGVVPQIAQPHGPASIALACSCFSERWLFSGSRQIIVD